MYFYTDWCGYCRQFEAQILSDDDVIAYLAAEVRAVRVNPEAGEAEAALAQRYGIRGFPALYLHADGRPGEFAAVRRTVMEAGQLRLKTPAEFISELGG